MTDSKQGLQYSGGLYNLTGKPLRFLRRDGTLKTTYPQEWSMRPYLAWPENPERELRVAAELEALIFGMTEVVGSFNSFIDLVRPTVDVHELAAFWQEKFQQGVRLCGMPDMKSVRKAPGMSQYCVVTPSVAMLASLQYQEMERLLMPAGAVVNDENGHLSGYQTLMPAIYLIGD